MGPRLGIRNRASLFFHDADIMSGRVQKSKSHSTVIKDRERAALIEYVESRSIDSDMPCTRCFRAKVPCRFGEKSTRCRTCIAAKKPCDGVLVASTRAFLFLLGLLRGTDFAQCRN